MLMGKINQFLNFCHLYLIAFCFCFILSMLYFYGFLIWLFPEWKKKTELNGQPIKLVRIKKKYSSSLRLHSLQCFIISEDFHLSITELPPCYYHNKNHSHTTMLSSTYTCFSPSLSSAFRSPFRSIHCLKCDSSKLNKNFRNGMHCICSPYWIYMNTVRKVSERIQY